MKKFLIAVIAMSFLIGAFSSIVVAETLVEFDGGIGVIPVSSVGDSNVVRGVDPGGQPWVIEDLDARVKDDEDDESISELRVRGEGLLLAGGNGIGTRGGVMTVVAALFCGDPDSIVPILSSGAVTLEPNGDFEIEETIDPPLPVPGGCENPVLLIRANGAGGPWIAAGIPILEDD